MNNDLIYDTIGKTYDATRKPDIVIVKQLLQFLSHQPNRKFLDIGCGSGNYTGALATKGLAIEGIDISEEMLRKARQKFPTIKFSQGDARNLPFQDESFDSAICILATHHINDNKKLFQEVFRILQKGHFVIFTATPEQMKKYWLCHYFPKMMIDAMKKMTNENEIRQVLESSGFKNLQSKRYFVTEETQDLFLHSGKHRPELYLDPKVRDGISSFHLSANQTELDIGLKNLAVDIESGEIKNIISKYENELGDYLFIIGQK